MGRIKKLAPDVSARIAAGEVIENPSSVVKELLENSLDAGSSSVRVRLVHGGMVSIQVEDNGEGIRAEDLPLAVERFATSKIQGVDDLDGIRTFGFRGEALASIAAVSRLEIWSSTEGETGRRLRVEGGEAWRCMDSPASKGTRIHVDDLFFNLPARRKFMKSASAETRRVSRLVRDYATAHPAVDFLLESDERTLYSSASLHSRLECLKSQWGDDPAPRSKSIVSGSNELEAWWRPGQAGSRLDLTLFVNGRRIRNPAVRAALGPGSAAAGQWFITMSIPACDIDVNIHPAKEEVRFRAGGDVFRMVRKAFEHLFGQGSPPLLGRNAGAGFASGAERFQGNSLFSRVAEPVQAGETPIPQIVDPINRPQNRKARFLGKLASGFLLYDSDGDLVIVDPHAAHERILYEKLERTRETHAPGQKLAEPVTLPPSLEESVMEQRERIESMGFVFRFSQGQLVLLEIPSGIRFAGVSPVALLRRAAGMADDGGGAVSEGPAESARALSACRGAIRIGDHIDPLEAARLFDDLMECTAPSRCPHGRPTFLRFSRENLYSQFGR